MKINHFLFLFLLLPAHSFAQQDSSRKAMGIFGETNAMFGGNRTAMMNTTGIQYNKWSRKHIGYKIIVAYSNYNDMPQTGISSIVQDTAIGKTANTNINMALLGFGIEAERQFYKKLYFFAGIELRAGYGSGATDTTETKEYNAPQMNPAGILVQGFALSSTDKTGSAATMFYLGFTPYFGLKLEFNKLSVGTEFKNYIYHTSVHSAAGTEGDTGFDSGNFSQSVFVQYKF